MPSCDHDELLKDGLMWPRLVHKKRNDECSMKIKTYLYCKKKGRKREGEKDRVWGECKGHSDKFLFKKERRAFELLSLR